MGVPLSTMPPDFSIRNDDSRLARQMSDSSATTIPRKFDTGLEGLRGLCCMIVLFSHLFPPGAAGVFFFPGLEAVLIFFPDLGLCHRARV
jgi:hypothetical protein